MTGRNEENGAAPRRTARVAILGASNVWLALPDIVQYLQARLGQRAHPLDACCDLFVAQGPGRSYGVDAGVGGVRWPGLVECGLYDGIREQIVSESASAETGPDSRGLWALLTDAGNDIPYRTGIDNLLRWIETCARRLDSLGARLAITGLPIESVRRLSPWRFDWIRRALFPFRPLSKESAVAEMLEVEAAIEACCRAVDGLFLPLEADWFGVDPIHLRRSLRRRVWQTWLDRLLGIEDLSGTPREDPPHASPGRDDLPPVSSLRLRRLRPQHDRLFGRPRFRARPTLECGPRLRIHAY